MAWSKQQKIGFLGFLLWVFGVGLTASLTFATGGPVPIIAGLSIWIGTWLNTRSSYLGSTETNETPKSHNA